VSTGSWAGVWGRDALSGVRVRTGRGWSGRSRRRAAGVPEVQPFLLAVPALGQVEGEVSPAVAGGAGGDGDQVAADGRCAGFRVQGAGQGARRADQVLRHGGDDQPGGIGVENTGK
jgi:hypothetical protein